MPNAAPKRKPGEPNPIVQLAILVAILAVMLNAGFYFLSESYFEDRVKRFGLQELARISGARLDFALFTIVIGLGSIGVAAYPRWLAHGIPALAGVLSAIAAVATLNAGLSVVLATVLFIASGMFGFLIRLSITEKSRPAWASLVAMCLVFGIVMLFAAPKIRGLVDIGLWAAMIVPGVFGIGAAALHQLRADYREPADP